MVENTCQKNCMGAPNNHGGCCTLGDRNFIIGRINDAQEFLLRLRLKFPEMEIRFEDVFISFEEGQAVPKTVWGNKDNYPALRIVFEHPLKPCIFYNTRLGFCTIYDIRPETCRRYVCEYLSHTEIGPKKSE